MFCDMQNINAQESPVITSQVKRKKVLLPQKAAMLSAVFPGMGQIYNRKYWKMPIVYAGFVGLGYGVVYNSTRYNNYTKAYQDFTDDIPQTDSYLGLVYQDWAPQTYDPVLYPDSYVPRNEQAIKELLLAGVDNFRKDRDLSFIGIAAWYMLSILDANVDASLSDYNIDDNLNLTLSPLQIAADGYIVTGVNVGLKITF